MGIDKFNHEGYSDPTTYEALTNIHRKEVAADKKAAYLPLVYICSPYAGDIENNVRNAKVYSRFAVESNAIPVTPHGLYRNVFRTEPLSFPTHRMDIRMKTVRWWLCRNRQKL